MNPRWDFSKFYKSWPETWHNLKHNGEKMSQKFNNWNGKTLDQKQTFFLARRVTLYIVSINRQKYITILMCIEAISIYGYGMKFKTQQTSDHHINEYLKTIISYKQTKRHEGGIAYCFNEFALKTLIWRKSQFIKFVCRW